MLTVNETGANGPRTVMLSIAEIALRDGVSKPTVSRKVKNLVEKHGLSVERDHQGRVAAVNAAEFDHLRGRFGDPSKTQAQRPALFQDQTPQSLESYDEAIRQKTWLDTEIKRLELAEQRGDVLRRKTVDEGLNRSGQEILRSLNRFSNNVERMGAAYEKGNIQGLRVVVNNLITEVREEMAKSLQSAAESEPATENDEPAEATNGEKI